MDGKPKNNTKEISIADCHSKITARNIKNIQSIPTRVRKLVLLRVWTISTYIRSIARHGYRHVNSNRREIYHSIPGNSFIV